MTREEIALSVIAPIVEDLKTRWSADAVRGEIDADGDNDRRLAAIKFRLADDLLNSLERAIKGT